MAINVLVLDDDSLVRGVFSTYFRMTEDKVDFSNSTHGALAKCREKHFDLVLLDYNITDMEAGWKIARDLREDPKAYGTPKIILMSGTVTPDATHALKLTADCYDLFIAKPFSLKELDSAIQKLTTES